MRCPVQFKSTKKVTILSKRSHANGRKSVRWCQHILRMILTDKNYRQHMSVSTKNSRQPSRGLEKKLFKQHEIRECNHKHKMKAHAGLTDENRCMMAQRWHLNVDKLRMPTRTRLRTFVLRVLNLTTWRLQKPPVTTNKSHLLQRGSHICSRVQVSQKAFHR